MVENNFYASTSNYKMLNVSFQSLQIQKIQSFEWENIYLKSKSHLVKSLIKSSIRESLF
jgi:hypothetical protein